MPRNPFEKPPLERTEPPLAVGQELELEIKDTGKTGDGVAYVDHFVVFVPLTRPGMTARVRIVKVWPRYAKAQVLSVNMGAGEQ